MSIKSDVESFRVRIQNTQKRLKRVQQGQAQGMDEASIHGEVDKLKAEFAVFEQKFKKEMYSGGIDEGEQKSLDDKVQQMKDQVTDIYKGYRDYMDSKISYQGGQAGELADASYDNMTQMKKKKDDNLLDLTKQVKEIKQGQKDIKEVLDEGEEVIAELHTNITDADRKVVESSKKMDKFKHYLSKNSIPFGILCLIIVLTVLVWSSKAFCSWGLTWQCNGKPPEPQQ